MRVLSLELQLGRAFFPSRVTVLLPGFYAGSSSKQISNSNLNCYGPIFGNSPQKSIKDGYRKLNINENLI